MVMTSFAIEYGSLTFARNAFSSTTNTQVVQFSIQKSPPQKAYSNRLWKLFHK